MNTYTRRSLLALASASALTTATAAARVRSGSRPLYSCGAVMGTPEVIRVESDIPFDQAYIDTTIPYHTRALELTDAAVDDLEDERAIAIAEEILASHPANLDELRAFRKAWFGDEEPAEATREHMLMAMGGVESCTDQSHMDFMDHDWVMDTFDRQDDPLFAWVSMMVLLLEMETHQHTVGVQLAEHEELRAFCERMVEEKTPQIEALKVIRGELFTRY